MSTTDLSELPLQQMNDYRPMQNQPMQNQPMQNQPMQMQNQPTTLDESTIHQIISGLQKASINGGTMLPSRDIPDNSCSMQQDLETQPNYIPQPTPTQQKDYIEDYNKTQEKELIKKYNKQKNRTKSFDEIYEQIQIPLLLAILYFLFQLPIIKKYLFIYLPFLFYKDGNTNFNYLLFTSFLFGLCFYILQNVIHFMPQTNE